MADQLQLRGGTTAEHATFTGASKELSVDTTKKTVVVHDGATAGGLALLREDVSNLAEGAITNAHLAGSIADSKLAAITTADKVALSALNIDGATDIGAALADADLIVVDDGGGGTNRKAAITRVSDYVFAKVSGDIEIGSDGTSGIVAGVIVDADISATAAVGVNKLAPGAARQVLQSNPNGDGVEWSDDLDVPGTLDVTQLATFDDAVTIGGSLTLGGTVVFEGTTADGFETTLIATDPTADNDIVLPDASGTLVLSGAIGNGDVAADAAIAGSKIDPDFGAQNITTTGDVSATNASITGLLQLPTALTVATLPETPALGDVAHVSDADAPALGETVAGGGAAAALCWYNGSAWTVIGL